MSYHITSLLFFITSSISRAREDLRLANQRITTIMADYSDVVPRREYERMETAYKVYYNIP